MGVKREPIIYKGRSLGILVLVVAQLLIGFIHVLFGFLLLAFQLSILQATVAYDVYTIIFGMLTSGFAVFIWQGKRYGWAGTIAISIFVIIADTLTLLNLPSIPGIPKFAAPTEIIYSIGIMAYWLSSNIRKKYLD